MNNKKIRVHLRLSAVALPLESCQKNTKLLLSHAEPAAGVKLFLINGVK
jgi:hypothetical protein